MARDKIDAALDENPAFLDSTASQRGSELQAARRMVPKQIVSNEYLVANRFEIAAHGFDGALTHGPRVQLPDRAEGTPERTTTRGFDQPHRTMGKAGVLFPPSVHMMTGRHRHVIERERPALPYGVHMLAVAAGQT